MFSKLKPTFNIFLKRKKDKMPNSEEIPCLLHVSQFFLKKKADLWFGFSPRRGWGQLSSCPFPQPKQGREKPALVPSGLFAICLCLPVSPKALFASHDVQDTCGCRLAESSFLTWGQPRSLCDCFMNPEHVPSCTNADLSWPTTRVLQRIIKCLNECACPRTS